MGEAKRRKLAGYVPSNDSPKEKIGCAKRITIGRPVSTRSYAALATAMMAMAYEDGIKKVMR